jgi:cysteinyl-tRNA synthetase
VYKREVVRVWMHNLFLLVDGGKMGKSLGNMYELADIKKREFDPMDLRYFFLMAHYRTRQNFSWETLKAARTTRLKMIDVLRGVNRKVEPGKSGLVVEKYRKLFIGALENDLMTPEALAVVWSLLKDKAVAPHDVLETMFDFDRILGLGLKAEVGSEEQVDEKLRVKIEQLIERRREFRESKDWDSADDIRLQLEKMGVQVEDIEGKTVWHQKR